MKQHRTQQEALDLALWRYAVVSRLLHLEEGERQAEVLAELADRHWTRDGQRVRISKETLRKWLYRYRRGGLPALQNETRKDKGQIAVPPTIAEALFDIRGQHPRWTTQRMLDQLLAEQRWNGRKPSRTALYRFVKAHNLGRNPESAEPSGRAFAYEAFGQLWQADFLHGPKIRQGRSRRKTYLHVILDDSSRYVVQARFALTENVETMLTELHDAIRRFGIPQRLYSDNGACYRSRHLALVCARLGITLVHTPPGVPRGRGKVERFFRTVREQFLQDHPAQSLEALEDAFATWLAGYHQQRHASLGCPPLEKRLGVRNATRKVPEVADLESLFLMERRCRLYKDGTIRLFGRRFEIPDPPAQPRITVYFMPWNLERVTYGDDGRLARPLDSYANAHRFQHPHPTKED